MKIQVTEAMRSVRREAALRRRLDVFVTLPVGAQARSNWSCDLSNGDKEYFRDCFVDIDDEVWAWDSVSETYSRHHDLIESEVQEARRAAALERSNL